MFRNTIREVMKKVKNRFGTYRFKSYGSFVMCELRCEEVERNIKTVIK